MSNLPLLIIGDYYYYSYERKWRPDRDMVRVLVGVIGCVPWPTRHSLVTLFSLSMSVKDRPLHWVLGKSQTYYPEHILGYGRSEDLLHWVSALSRPTDWRRGWWRSKHRTESGT